MVAAPLRYTGRITVSQTNVTNPGETIRPPDATSVAAERYALAVVLPLWMLAGSTDYALHRRSRIEATSGTYEARLHLLGIALAAPPALAGLLCEIDAGVIALMAAGYVAHLGMTISDVAYADERRRIVPFEQHVHALLELMPFVALSLAGLAHRAQLRALLGRGEAPRFAFRRKRRPVPPLPLAATVAAFGLLVALPFAKEYVRCVRYARTARENVAYAPRATP